MTINCQVAVVGSGIAGLGSADYLIQKGIQADILEQSDRVGGRIWSPKSPSGQHWEEGAFTFSDVESTVNQYVQRFGLEKIEQTHADKRFKFKEIVSSFSEKAAILEGSETKIPLSSLLSHYLNKIQVDICTDCTIYEALANAGASETAIEWLGKNTLLGLIGNDMHEVSAYGVKVYLEQYENSTKFYALRGGNGQLCQALAQQFPNSIHYDFNVSKVVVENKKIFLSNPEKMAVADSAIFAIPLTALGQIEFLPELPDDKKLAIATIGYTSCSRLTVEGPSDLLGEAAGGVFAITDQPAGWFRNQTLFQTNPHGNAIFNWSAVGATSKEMNQKDPNVAIPEIMQGLDAFVTLPRENLKFNFFSWDRVSWIQGGYSYFPPKTFPLQAVLKRPEGQIYFAGEHTSEKYASMNGALESGIRAAEELLSTL